MALVEDGGVPGARQLDMRDSGYSVTAGTFVSVARLLAGISELSPDIPTVDAGPEDRAASSLGAACGPLSGYRLGQDLGWVPESDLTSGLAEHIQWRREAPLLDQRRPHLESIKAG